MNQPPRATVRSTAPGQPGATVIHVGPSAPAPMTARERERARMKLEHAAKGHAQLAVATRALAAAASDVEAAVHTRVAEEHEKIVADLLKQAEALK